jgi:hypothetical protein
MKKAILPFRMVMPNKILLALVIAVVTAGMAWAADGKFGEINLKAGYQFEGLTRDNITEWFNYDINNFYQTDPGFYFGAEYLYSFFDKTLKIGAGAQYELPKEAWDGWSGEAADLENERVKYSLLPVYVTVQYSPVKKIRELFIKGSIGYNVLTSIELLPDGIPRPGLDEKKGGIYWQASAGFEADWGLLFECFYSQKRFSAKWDFSDLGMPATANDLYKAKDFGFSIGYKIKL